MSQNNKVFITGRSAVTASGNTADATWESICGGQSGIAEIQEWDLSQWPARLGGELKNIQPAKMLPDRKLIKVISRQDVIGINAAVQAVEHSQMIPHRDGLSDAAEFNDLTAVFIGSPGNKYMQQYDFLPLLAKSAGNTQSFAQQLFDEVHPMWLLRILPNNVLAYTGITYGFKGVNHNVTNHAAGGTQALMEAYYAIRSGQAERAVVVAYDMALEPQSLFYYEKLGVLSARDLKPFDADHDGTIMAEGAAALVLESERSVQARSAKCYGEVISGLSSSEASGLFAIEGDARNLTELMKNTLEKASLKPENIDFVVAHGNGNVKSDDTEALAIQTVFSQQNIPVTAFKWSVGHTICASGLIDAVMATYALEHSCIPGIANLQQPAAGYEGMSLTADHQSVNKTSYSMIINRGFASMNTCLVLKGCE